MPQDIFASNGPTTTVSSGGTTAPSAGTSETWTVASSTGFPAAATGVSQFRIADRTHPSEIMIVTSVSGTTWTVTRGAESTTPVAHTAGFTIYQALTAGVLGAFPQYVNVLSFGADPSGAADSTSAINAALTAVTGSGKGATVFFPAGSYKISGTLSVNSANGVTLLGCGGATAGAAAGTKLTFSNTGSGALISAQNSAGFRMRAMQVIYTSGSFTGNLLDLRNVSGSDTALFEIRDCLFAGSGVSTATNCINLDKAISGSVIGCNFTNAVYGIAGRASGNYSNSMRIADNHFAQLTTCAIISSGQGWLIEANTFEPLQSGAAGAYTFGSGQTGNGVIFQGNWMGDVTAGGTWINWAGNNLIVTGNYIGGDASTTALAVTTNSCLGIEVTSNDFVTLNKAVDLGSTTGHTNFAVMFNTYTTVTTKISATTWPTGGVHYDGANFRAGNFQLTGEASGSGHGVIFDALTGGDTAASVRGGTGLYVTGSGTEKLRLDASVTVQHSATSVTTTSALASNIPGVILAKNAITLTLPTPSNGFRSYIKNVDSANSVTLTASSGKIDNATSVTLAPLQGVEIAGDGVNWWILSDLPLGQYVNVLSFGADPSGTNDSTTAINAALAVVSATNAGATVFFPAGSYKISGTLSANSSSGVTLLGCGGTTGGATAGSKLLFSNTGSGALISATSTIGFRLRDMQVVYSSGSFTGNMVDLRNVSAGDTALFTVSGCLFAASSTASAAACIALDKANSGTVDGCNFEGATYGILGRASGASYSNGSTVRGCQFVNLGTAGIRNPGQGWTITGNTFENLSGGGAGGVLCDSGAGTYGTEITGNWFGDATVNSGSPISINGGGFSVHGNYIGYITGMTAVVVGASSVGFMIKANRFDPGGGTGTTAVSLGSGCSSYDCTGNGGSALGLPVPQTDILPSGAIYAFAHNYAMP